MFVFRSQFDWIRAQEDFGHYLIKLRARSIYLSVFGASFWYRQHTNRQMDEQLDERRKKGLPEVPRIEFLGENEFYKDYIAD